MTSLYWVEEAIIEFDVRKVDDSWEVYNKVTKYRLDGYQWAASFSSKIDLDIYVESMVRYYSELGYLVKVEGIEQERTI